LLKQLDAYAEDKYEDEDDMRDQLRSVARKESRVGNITSQEALNLWWKELETSSPDSFASLQATLKALARILDQSLTS
jgi:hypothetical protein